uniref:Uncharacterized protein n=1 Tax=Oryza rufipogon TaxID=4529 RepID=A0A0E0NH86_ORYRU
MKHFRSVITPPQEVDCMATGDLINIRHDQKAGQPILPAREILPAPDASKPRTPPPNPNLENQGRYPPIPRKQSSKLRD